MIAVTFKSYTIHYSAALRCDHNGVHYGPILGLFVAVPRVLAPAQPDLDLDRDSRKLGMVPQNIPVVLMIY